MSTAPFVRPDVQALLSHVAGQDAPQMSDLDPAAARDQYRTMIERAELPPCDVARVEDIQIPSPQGHAIPVRLYADYAGEAPGTVVVFFHGGGWVLGDLDTHHALCTEIARGLGLAVVSVDYRLAPEHPFPAGLEDCLAATRWAASGPAEIGHAVTGVVIAGDSAGGNLAAATAQAVSAALAVPVVAQWLMYPRVDMTASGGSMRELIEGYLLSAAGMAWFAGHYGADPTDPRVSPLLDGGIAALPPSLVFTCALDPLRDQGREYAAQLVRHGVSTTYREAAGLVHGGLNLRRAIPSARADLEACLADLRTMLAAASSHDVRAFDHVSASVTACRAASA